MILLQSRALRSFHLDQQAEPPLYTHLPDLCAETWHFSNIRQPDPLARLAQENLKQSPQQPTRH